VPMTGSSTRSAGSDLRRAAGAKRRAQPKLRANARLKSADPDPAAFRPAPPCSIGRLGPAVYLFPLPGSFCLLTLASLGQVRTFKYGRNFEKFASDCELVFDNCIKYNGRDSEIGGIANQVKNYMKGKMAKCRAELQGEQAVDAIKAELGESTTFKSQGRERQ